MDLNPHGFVLVYGLICWWNFQVSLAARQLINALLNRDPASRLGSNGGANEIKDHLFFRGINWPLIRNMVYFWLPLMLFCGILISWTTSASLKFFLAEPSAIRSTSEVYWKRSKCKRCSVGWWGSSWSSSWLVLERERGISAKWYVFKKMINISFSNPDVCLCYRLKMKRNFAGKDGTFNRDALIIIIIF